MENEEDKLTLYESIFSTDTSNLIEYMHNMHNTNTHTHALNMPPSPSNNNILYYTDLILTFQHMRYHNDPTALSHSFHEVITASDIDSSELRSLRNRCLFPGHYAQHLVRWLDYFPARQVC